ncbi:helix-turn-helix transcriptional regulator [Nocardioides sp. zg-DK7169]|nr:helix-turn-helix transcriptional regulator [Nocardioides sp. zg-DK7169]
MSTYGQFCPVAKAMEILDERWTLLIVRELLSGSSRFNEIRRGVPRMSPALLAKRLRTLERAGVLERREERGGVGYRLTESGRELSEVVEALGRWGVRWIGELGVADLDPHLLMWDMRRTVPVGAWPRERTVVAFHFTDVGARQARWWMCVRGNEVDVCDHDPGFETSVWLRTTLRGLTEVWRGDREWADLLADPRTSLEAVGAAGRELPAWLGRSAMAAVPRP